MIRRLREALGIRTGIYGASRERRRATEMAWFGIVSITYAAFQSCQRIGPTVVGWLVRTNADTALNEGCFQVLTP